MKTFLTTAFAILLFTVTCRAQWGTSGTYIYNTNAGNVGIGTTNPSQALQIISGNTSGTFGTFASASGQGLSINPNSIAGTVNVFADYIGGGAEPKLHLSTTSGRFNAGGITIAVSGNVGVGTATPLALHHIVVPSAKATVTGSVASLMSTNDASNPFGLRTMIYGASAIANRYVTLQTTDYSLVDGGSVVLQPSNGNVGIGTTTPAAKLDVNGVVSASNDIISTNGTVKALLSVSNSYTTGVVGTSTNHDLAIYTNSLPVARFTASGNMGIGTTTPDQKLTVNGTVHSKAVVVDNSIFPDYVFNKTYALRPLSAVKTYIDLNHHLPEMPSATEVAKNGQNLGEINALLLKKVEELTLYMIEKDKQVKALEQQKEILQQQQAQINQLKKQVEELIKAKK